MPPPNAEKSCEFRILSEFNIEPYGKHSEQEHYDYWHGNGKWQLNGQHLPSNEPTWSVSSSGATVLWGVPPNQTAALPNGFSAPIGTVDGKIACGGGNAVTTITAVPAEGGEENAVTVTITYKCKACKQ